MIRLNAGAGVLILSCLMSVMLAQAESGIDWGASYMMAEFSAENTAVPTLDCFGYSDRSADPGACNSYAGAYDDCVWEYLDELGYSDESTSPEIDSCYQQAGNYQITVQLIDYAGNESIPIVNDFVIKAGAPDADTSILAAASDCSDLSLAATGSGGSNACVLTLTVKDEFGNPVTQIKGQAGEFYSEAEFPSDANAGDLGFRSGTKVTASTIAENFIPSTSGTALSFTIDEADADDSIYNTFDLTAWAPSIRQVGEFLGANEPFSYDLKFVLPSVDASGNLDLASPVTFEYDQYAPQIGFAPWARVSLDIDAIPKQYLIDVDTAFEITRNLVLPNSGGPNNPFNVFLTVHDLDPTLAIEDLDFDPVAELVDEALESIVSVLRVVDDNAQTGGSISFSSRIEYDITDGATYTIAYPSGSLGTGFDETGDDHNNEDVSTSLIGVSVEGKILGSKDAVVINDPSSFNGVQISEGDSLADIRREVFENAIRITRSLSSKTAPGVEIVPFDASWYTTEDVAYVTDKDVVITASSGDTVNMPTGQKTLVIQNGNLIIEDNLAYASDLDSFGFILINDAIESEPATGNIFVKDSVQKIVGTYFSEGGLMSIDVSNINITDTGDITLTDSDNNDDGTGANTVNHFQLIIEGTMLTHNTLGGGIFQPTAETYLTPWETLDASSTPAPKELRAQRYDLHYLRSYSPEYARDGDGNITGQDNDDKCYPGGNTYGCYENNAATVIRYDGKAVKNPPPGFEGASFFAR